MLMADLGADVIKIEAPVGDILRHLSMTFTAGFGSWFVNFNRNKRSLVLDLKQPAARDVSSRWSNTVTCSCKISVPG
jgi:crotonobetainyl-CoA:carnitine CoA-transferase CaiB-like acyl-CoA transferase